MLRMKVALLGLLLPSLFIAEAKAAVPMVAAGDGFSVALRDDGRVMTWGTNIYSQLGAGLNGGLSSTPVLVPGLSNVVSIAAGYWHTLALKADGSVWGWGSNAGGQLGADTSAAYNSPQQIAGLSKVTAVAAGKCQSVVLKQDGTVWRIGSAKNGWDAMGFKPCQDAAPMSPVSGFSNSIAIAATDYYIVAVKEDGTVWASGYFVPGQADPYDPKLYFLQLSGFNNIKAVAAADDHIVALRQDGTVWAMGLNAEGQLGDGSTTDRSSAVQMLDLANVTSIAAAPGATLALKKDGSVWWSGAYGFGIGGYGTSRMTGYHGNRMWISSPAQFPGLAKIQAIANSSSDSSRALLFNYFLHHTVAVQQDGTLLAWGSNYFGQLGDGTSVDSDAPGYVVNETASGALSVTPDIPLDQSTLPLHYLLTTKVEGDFSQGEAQSLSATLTSLPMADYLVKGYLSFVDVLSGLVGDVYFSAFYRDGSSSYPTATSLGANSNKPTGPGAIAEPIYSGGIHSGSTWTYRTPNHRDSLDIQNAIVCIGITFPRLAAKGMVLMRPIYNGVNFTPSTLCPTVQTPMTAQLYQGQASGPLTAKKIVAQINPLDEDRGKVMNVYSWAVAPQDNYYHLSMAYMQTSAGWRSMVGAVQPVMTVTVPASGPITLTVADGLDLSNLPGTLFYVGLGTTWDEVKNLNRAGHYYTAQ